MLLQTANTMKHHYQGEFKNSSSQGDFLHFSFISFQRQLNRKKSCLKWSANKSVWLYAFELNAHNKSKAKQRRPWSGCFKMNAFQFRFLYCSPSVSIKCSKTKQKTGWKNGMQEHKKNNDSITNEYLKSDEQTVSAGRTQFSLAELQRNCIYWNKRIESPHQLAMLK